MKLYLRKTLRVLQVEISRGIRPEHSCRSILMTRALPCRNLNHWQDLPVKMTKVPLLSILKNLQAKIANLRMIFQKRLLRPPSENKASKKNRKFRCWMFLKSQILNLSCRMEKCCLSILSTPSINSLEQEAMDLWLRHPKLILRRSLHLR